MEGSTRKFSKTLQNVFKVSVGNNVYNLTKYKKQQIIDTTIIKYPNQGGYWLQQRNIKCDDITNRGKKNKEHPVSNTPTARPGATL